MPGLLLTNNSSLWVLDIAYADENVFGAVKICFLFRDVGYILVAGGKSMKFIITITRDEEGVYIADCPAIPGCMSQGKTEEEAQENIHEAIN